MAWWSKLRNSWRGDRLSKELEEEIQAHLEMRIEENIRAGMTEEVARCDARQRFGNKTFLKEETRGMDVIGWLDTAARDLKYALRMLRRSPGFTGSAVVTLALGIGANTAIFTLLDQILLRLLPVKAPQELVLLTMRGRHYGNNWGGNAISYPMYKDFKEHNEVFSDMFARFPNDASLTFGGQAERVQVELVSGSYFDVLGVGTELGRTITPDDDRVPNGHPGDAGDCGGAAGVGGLRCGIHSGAALRIGFRSRHAAHPAPANTETSAGPL